MDDARLEEIYEQLREIVRELSPALDEAGVEAAIARLLYYAEREGRKPLFALERPLENARPHNTNNHEK